MVKNADRVRATKKMILQAARTLLNSKQPDKITLKDVAEESGLSRSAVYLYYENMCDILLACSKEYYFGLHEKFTMALEACLDEQSLAKLVKDEYLRSALLIFGDPRAYEMLETYHDAQRGYSLHSDFREQAGEAHARIMKRYYPNQSMYAAPVETLGLCLVCACDNIARTWIAQDFPVSPEQIAEQAARTDLEIMHRLTGQEPVFALA